MERKKIVDGEDVTFKQAMRHAAAAAFAGSAANMTGIAVAKAIASNQTATAATASADLVEAVGEPTAQPSEAKLLAKRIPSPLAEKGTKFVIEKAAEFTEKQLDDSVECGSSKEHFVVCQGLTPEWRDAVTKAISENLFDGTVTYITKGWNRWFTKMIVSYYVNGKKIKKQVKGSRKYIKIPSNATEIKVSFEVWRPPWRDVIRYDRFQKCWCKPSKPHIFKYDTPPIRTFTIRGIGGWAAVMAVTDEHNNETNEM